MSDEIVNAIDGFCDVESKDLKGLQIAEKIAIAAGLSVSGASVEEIAQHFGVHFGTIYRWMRDDRWAEAMTILRRGVLNEMWADSLQTIREAIRSGDAQTARWALERIDPATFGAPSARVAVETSSDEPVKITIHL